MINGQVLISRVGSKSWWCNYPNPNIVDDNVQHSIIATFKKYINCVTTGILFIYTCSFANVSNGIQIPTKDHVKPCSLIPEPKNANPECWLTLTFLNIFV